jgi:predicted nicotinamide N-methyase
VLLAPARPGHDRPLSPLSRVRQGGGRRAYSRRVAEELVIQSVELPSGALRLLQPREAAELPDSGPVEWAPVAPYWAVLWRSGVALALELDGRALRALRVVELGCGLAVPSLAAARAGAAVLATDACPEALELVSKNAEANGLRVDIAAVDWAKRAAPTGGAPPDALSAGELAGRRQSDVLTPGELAGRGPFDLVLAADVLYERAGVAPLLSLLPRLAPEVWLADPGRPAAAAFLEQASRRWQIETLVRGVVRIHRMRLG